MELELYRHDLVQTSSSARNTLAVLPQGEEKKTQKVAVGDLAGVIQCFSIKKGEIAMAFKTLPSSQKITSLSTGKGRGQKDRLFIGAGDHIKGYSRKGKEFFKFNTQLTEALRKVHVFEKNIWLAAEYVHNHYIEGKDKAFYLCPDRINDSEVLPLISAQDYCPALACQDRHIRLLSGNEVFYEAPTPAAPISLVYNPESHDPSHRFPHAKELLYGTETGTLVQLMCESNQARQGFTLQNPKKLGAIRAIYSGIDFSKTGSNDIVVGREDGVLEIYDVDETGQLQQIFNTKLTESVNTLDGGFITSTNTQEVVLHTFSGKVLTYAPPGGGITLPATDKRAKTATTEEEERRAGYNAQISRLRTEIDDLRMQLDMERTRFSKSSNNSALLAVSAPFTVNDRCKLEPEEACYSLCIECAMPIFTVAIQCTIPLQLLDVSSNVAILSRSPPDEANGNMTLATYRCQDATSRITVKFKVREGKSGSLQAFIIPNISPKTCVSVSHRIRPLCLHTRIPSADSTRPTNELLITGTFDLSDAHNWMAGILPDLPPITSGQDTITLYYQNTLLGTQLTCKYRAGEARFYSDLITTLGIIHESFMREATNAKQRVNVSFNPSSSSLQHSIALVWPQLEKQRTLKKKFQLLESLMELKMQDDGDVSYLTPEYKGILDDAEGIRTAYKEQPQHLDHLTALIKDLYLDFCRLTGISTPKQRLPMLEQLLADTRSTLQQVMDFMLGKL
mmetsp:Transcript_18765/g.40356  ORF Transcript_18765/g.40356 Transcript_18765/m.40356 type:complete len:735 (+) Transcript_18765:308-2512(+)|eukprot:CAMPEP_0202904210 /NCGR_PEP_ID=MMETSP1392-20130828/28326_1 /ASSEMBLY_ACC=CAM_ASM_000868 /TAXON_ID=225041 /ORGANISM="Chlamydomonas chlamydogama, Strain SAG 11-48b" /LENGTH=734 /DNA_ID=CAMNT_0049591737 /DNA_START=214 /DNA_END=2418 /DNA_ORIENTATION=+